MVWVSIKLQSYSRNLNQYQKQKLSPKITVLLLWSTLGEAPGVRLEIIGDMSRKRVDVNKILVSVPDYIQKVQCDTNKQTTPFKCAVVSCPNAFLSFKDHHASPYKFHNFPVDVALRKIWKRKCGLSKTANVKDMKVCSNHFKLDSYVRNYKEEFSNPDFKRKLRANAVPILNLNEYPENLDSEPEDSDGDITESDEVPEDTTIPFHENKEVREAVNLNLALKKRLQGLWEEERRLKIELSACVKESNKVRANIVKLDKKEKLKNKDPLVDIVHKVFSPAQIDLLKKKRAHWSDDDLARAFSLRHIGTKECYLYLKNTLNLPLPSLSCVQKWAASYYGKN